jgi:hypothetical protein
VLLEKDGDQLDPSCEKLSVLHGVQEERNILPAIKKKEG